jgi:hypothetical protein
MRRWNDAEAIFAIVMAILFIGLGAGIAALH